MASGTLGRTHLFESEDLDLSLFRRWSRGDRAGQRAFMRRFEPVLRAVLSPLCAGRGGSLHDRDDLVQEGFLFLLLHGDRLLAAFRPERGALRTLIRKAVKHHVISLLRAGRARPQAAAAPDLVERRARGADPFERYAAREQLRRLPEAVAALGARDQELFHAHFDQHLDAQLLAARTKVAAGALHQRKSRLIARLSQRLRRPPAG